MNDLLALMHNTMGKTSRIKLRVEEFTEELNKTYPSVLKEKVSTNKNLEMSFFLADIKNQVIQLQEELDLFYIKNQNNV